MKLDTAVKLHAGGPGSGCRGDNCGRPKSGESADAEQPSILRLGKHHIKHLERFKQWDIAIFPSPKSPQSYQALQELKKAGYIEHGGPSPYPGKEKLRITEAGKKARGSQ